MMRYINLRFTLHYITVDEIFIFLKVMKYIEILEGILAL